MVACAACGGCSSEKNCDRKYIEPRYQITVTDGATGESICDANVTVNAEVSSPADCKYSHQIPSDAASVTIAASRAGYVSGSKEVSTKYEQDECGKAIAMPVKLVLEPL